MLRVVLTVYRRIGVARRLPEIVEEIKLQASKDHILPIIDALVSDDSPEVRETMMEQVLSMCAVFNSVRTCTTVVAVMLIIH